MIRLWVVWDESVVGAFNSSPLAPNRTDCLKLLTNRSNSLQSSLINAPRNSDSSSVRTVSYCCFNSSVHSSNGSGLRRISAPAWWNIIYFYCLQLGTICTKIIQNKPKQIVRCLKKSKLTTKL